VWVVVECGVVVELGLFVAHQNSTGLSVWLRRETCAYGRGPLRSVSI
jgi:hypothetical protein